MMVRGQFAQLMAPGLRDMFVHWLDMLQRAEEYSLVFNIENSTAAYEDEVEFSGLGPMAEKPEAEAIQYEDAIQGGTKRYIHTTFALGVRSSWELYEDDQYQLIKQVPKAIARSAHFSREQSAWNVFNLGFTTITTIDGVSLFNAAHPLLGGPRATNIGPGVSSYISSAGTFPNRPAVDQDLSFSAIQLALDQYERIIDSQGLPVALKPKFLVIPPELRWLARELLGSPYRPTDANNAINSLLAEDLQVIKPHYLTSRTAWYLLADKSETWLKFYNRFPLTEDYSDDFDTRSIKMIAYQRFSVGATHWWGVWGSNGP